MNFTRLHHKKRFFLQRLLILGFLLWLPFASQSQYYSFAKSTGTYSEITGGTSLLNGNWDDFSKLFKTPFSFKFFFQNINDSIEVTDWGGLYFNSINNGYFDVFGTDLNSRGNNKSEVSYKTEGGTPNRILKIQFHNAGFMADAPAFNDSMNFQLWIYETSSILEFRYGPNQVKSTSYNGEMGPYVQIADPLTISTNFIVLEGNPSNPTLRTANMSFATTLTGTPPNGTIYRFTPSAWHTGIEATKETEIIVKQNKIHVSPNIEIQSIHITNMKGQLLQSASRVDDIDLYGITPGLYIITINSTEGMISKKLIR